uniref:RRM domain-containing protein n=2 Tax=Parascaris univalens TaxID=6257 RepID=A0A915A5J2_PARUN
VARRPFAVEAVSKFSARMAYMKPNHTICINNLNEKTKKGAIRGTGNNYWDLRRANVQMVTTGEAKRAQS